MCQWRFHPKTCIVSMCEEWTLALSVFFPCEARLNANAHMSPAMENRPLVLKYDFAVGGSVLDSTFFLSIF